MTSATSFQKKTRSKVLQIAGTRPSLHNNQLLVSTGIPSLDSVLGGGMAVGTVLLVEEDSFTSYSRLLLKYFLAEGIMCQHSLLVASANTETSQLINELPGPVLDDPGVEPGGSTVPGPAGSTTTDNMTIAWRYQNLPQDQSSRVSCNRYGNYYDLTKTMPQQLVDHTDKMLLDIDSQGLKETCSQSLMKPSYAKLLTVIKARLEDGNFGTAGPRQQKRNILRIGVHSLGSPLWGEEGCHTGSGLGHDPSLLRFLYALRALLRTAFATCLITMPTHLFQDVSFVRKLEHMSDCVVRLESFVGTNKETNPAYREYHGLFHLLKLPRLNSLVSHMPDTFDLAFKLRRKKFMIERLHLPPELSDTASRNQEDPVMAATVVPGCGTGGHSSSKLDF